MDKDLIIVALAVIITVQNAVLMLWRNNSKLKLVENKEPVWSAASHYWHLRAKIKGSVKDYLFTDRDLVDAEVRAEKNPEDVP